MGAASSTGYPKMPVEIAGNAIDASCISSAIRIDSRWQLARVSGSPRISARPDRPDGMNNVACRQTACGRSHGLTLWKRPLLRDDLAAMLFNFRSAGGVNGAVNATSTHQRRVGGIHNGVSLLARDVGWTGDDKRAAFAEINAQRVGEVGQSDVSNRIPSDDCHHERLPLALGI